MSSHNIQHEAAPPVEISTDNPGHKFPRVETETLSVKLRAAQKRQPNASNRLIDVKPTLKQVWKQDELISAICVQSVDVHVSCSSHGISELAPFFIDP